MRAATKLVQSMLAAAGSPVAEDGVWGPNTDLAYRQADPNVRASIDEALRRWEKTSVDDIRANAAKRRPNAGATGAYVGYRTPPGAKTAVQARGDAVIVKPEAAIALAQRFERVFSLPRGTLEQMLKLEAKPLLQNRQVVGYDAAARGGSGGRYLGLYQFFDRETAGNGAPYAWGMARQFARKFGMQLPSLTDGWRDPAANTAAAGAYAAYHAERMGRDKIKPTPALLYAAHQQGYAAVVRGVKTGSITIAGNQSPASVSVINSAIRGA